MKFSSSKFKVRSSRRYAYRDALNLDVARSDGGCNSAVGTEDVSTRRLMSILIVHSSFVPVEVLLDWQRSSRLKIFDIRQQSRCVIECQLYELKYQRSNTSINKSILSTHQYLVLHRERIVRDRFFHFL